MILAAVPGLQQVGCQQCKLNCTVSAVFEEEYCGKNVVADKRQLGKKE